MANVKELYYGQLVVHVQKYSKRRAELYVLRPSTVSFLTALRL
jgi:hypothetical protein